MVRYKGTQVIDLFFGEFNGYYANRNKEKGDRVVPLIRTTNSVRAKFFDYELDPQENMVTVPKKSGGEIMFLIPDTNIPGLSQEEFEQTIWAQLQDEAREQFGKMDQRIRELQEENERLQSELRDLRRRTDDQNKGGSGQQLRQKKRLKCQVCNKSSGETDWDSSDKEEAGKCPNCGRGAKEKAETVTV